MYFCMSLAKFRVVLFAASVAICFVVCVLLCYVCWSLLVLFVALLLFVAPQFPILSIERSVVYHCMVV